MPDVIDAWEMTPEQYVEKFTRYRGWLGSLWTNYYQPCLYMITRDGMTGRVVNRTHWILENLGRWADDDLSLVAYCTRSLLELVAILWSVDRTDEWQRFFALAATDVADCAKMVMRLGIGPEEEGRQLLEDLKQSYKQVELAVPEDIQRARTDAKNAGYLREYDEAFKLLSKFVHPTPLVLFSPPTDADILDTIRTYFFSKAIKYVHTIYCLAAEQSGYNPAELDLTGQLAQLRAELAQ
jgi:hypothetical protein